MILLKRRTASKILIFFINNNEKINIIKLSRAINVTYTSVIIRITELTNIGLMKTIKHGRERYCEVTKKGKEVANLLLRVDNLCN